jgi:isoquinoline 1-oxidoreductase alpha subunit
VPLMDGDVRLLPMARDEQDRLGPLGQAVDQTGEIGLHRPPHRIGRAAAGSMKKQGPPPCGMKSVARKHETSHGAMNFGRIQHPVEPHNAGLRKRLRFRLHPGHDSLHRQQPAGRVQDGPAHPLLWALRDASNLTGTKYGCGTGDCGACTVDVDGPLRLACQETIGALEGTFVTTIEGFRRIAAIPSSRRCSPPTWSQCGYCIPGIVMAASVLLRSNRNPSEEDIKSCDPQHLPVRHLSAADRRDHRRCATWRAAMRHWPQGPNRRRLRPNSLSQFFQSPFAAIQQPLMRRSLIQSYDVARPLAGLDGDS